LSKRVFPLITSLAVGAMIFSIIPAQTAFGYDLIDSKNPSPYLEHIFNITADLSISNGVASLSGNVTAQSGTSSIKVDATLYRIEKNGSKTAVKTWSNNNSGSNVLNWSSSYAVAKGYDYQLTFTSTVVRNGSSETASKNSNIVYAN